MKAPAFLRCSPYSASTVTGPERETLVLHYFRHQNYLTPWILVQHISEGRRMVSIPIGRRNQIFEAASVRHRLRWRYISTP